MEPRRKALCIGYAIIAVIALIATWSQNIAFFAAGDAGLIGFIEGGYANHAAASLTNDLLLLTLAAVVFMIVEARRHKVRFVWAYIVLAFVVAISVTFPLFLIARELRLQAASRTVVA